MKKALVLMAVVAGLMASCSFSEYSQSEKVMENIDDHRTGCEIDVDKLLAGYKQYEANRFYSPGYGDTPRPTPTPSPVDDSDLAIKVLLEQVWENGCQTGRRDAVGAEQATLMGLRDQLELFEARIAALEPTPTPTASATPTSS